MAFIVSKHTNNKRSPATKHAQLLYLLSLYYLSINRSIIKKEKEKRMSFAHNNMITFKQYVLYVLFMNTELNLHSILFTQFIYLFTNIYTG